MEEDPGHQNADSYFTEQEIKELYSDKNAREGARVALSFGNIADLLDEMYEQGEKDGVKATVDGYAYAMRFTSERGKGQVKVLTPEGEKFLEELNALDSSDQDSEA